ncbi:MAG: ribbon-helix-helix domain-containing protein [Pseudomonadota bacterium]
MCQIFAGQDPADYDSETRSMRINGLSTSIRLETSFWRVLDDIATREGLTVAQFVCKLHDEVIEHYGEARNFTSLLRCACLIHVRRDRSESRPDNQPESRPAA